MSELEKLRTEVEAQKDQNNKLHEQLQELELCNELEKQRQQKEEWEATMERLKVARQEAAELHHKRLEQIKRTTPTEPAGGEPGDNPLE